ncbi:unnamed protein product [Sphenostylis stenocarpa]|uniref:Serine aminopeptidase S33 domain-containing protein n=1 Tax=Sphenostylis stenocarpa TaxID=92480 RepID=A0AA86SJ44_9FABA|nr:unnamed protein product [Sphenostylis stenocarpa]
MRAARDKHLLLGGKRAEYNPDQYLWEKEFTLASRTYQRQDLEASMDIINLIVLKNARGYTLKCSHYLPSPFPEDTSLPCVIYCHGNSGCRADANEAAVILLPSNITVFTLDFSGSGLSDGDYVSLGWHEKDDLKIVVSYLRNNKQISRIGLWGRSMGAVTSLLYGAEDPSIAGMVLDSAFSNLYNLMMELVDVYKIRLPKFTVKMAVQYMRRVIEKKAKFDIMNLNCLLVAPKTFIPVLFGHASDDKFIQPHHSDLISESYAGDKNVIKFDGDHNSSRPQFFYDSVSIFFYNVLHPPNVPRAHKLEKYYDLGDLKLGNGVDEHSLELSDGPTLTYSALALWDGAKGNPVRKLTHPNRQQPLTVAPNGHSGIPWQSHELHHIQHGLPQVPLLYHAGSDGHDSKKLADSSSFLFANVETPNFEPSTETTIMLDSTSRKQSKLTAYTNNPMAKPVKSAEDAWATTSLLYEILSSLRSASTDAASSSSVLPTISTTKSVCELLSEVAPVTDVESFFREDTDGNDETGYDIPTDVQDKLNGEREDCCSYTSSNRESWGRCSSLGGSDEESCEDLRADDTLSQSVLHMHDDVFATPMRSMNEKSLDPKEGDDKKHKKKNKKKKKKKDESVKKPKSERFEKLEALSRRLRLCLMKGSNHRRHKSS